jgi:uncharacterized protein
MKKVVIAGGTGFIGNYLSKCFHEFGYQVRIISRASNHLSWSPVELAKGLEAADLVINLAGKSVNCRQNNDNKNEIVNSRVNTTLAIGNAILNCKNPPKLWVNASAVGVYKPSARTPMTEDEVKLGTDFLADVVCQWESALFSFQLPSTRKVALRTSVVLGRDGGALKPLRSLAKFLLGGKQGDGSQYFSWIHEEDYFRILLFLLENSTLDGVINCTSPTPVSNSEFMHLLRKRLRVHIGIPAPKFAVKLGAAIFGISSDLILNSSYVIPKRLEDAGFVFNYPTLDLALIELIHSY